MGKKLKILMLVLSVLFCNIEGKVPVSATEKTEKEAGIEEPSELYAISACLMDADTGRVLFEKNGQEERAMASTTKIMTLIVTLENADLDSVVTVSSNAAKQPDVQLTINEGEQYYLKDLLYSLMLESHNDSAVAIAEHVAGSVEAFAGLMNQKAEELGLSQTHFVTPNGLDGEDAGGTHRTTAVELAKIMSYCISQSSMTEEFLAITRTASYNFSDLEGKRSFTCNNHNAFLSMMDGALSGKTGFTANAGYCYVGALKRDGKTFVVSLLGCGWPNHKSYKWSDTKTLMNYGLQGFECVDIYDREKVFEPILVVDGQKTAAAVGISIAEEEKTLPFLLRRDETYRIEYKLPKELAAPVETGEKIGEVNYYIGEELVMQYPVCALEKVEKIDLKWCLERLLKIYFIL